MPSDWLSLRKLPKYVRLAAHLRQQIQEGVFCPGDALPSLRDLMREHHVTLVTVNKALDELKHEGWIESVQGCGTFVKQKSCKPVVGLVMPGQGEFYGSFMRTMLQAIQDANWQASYWPTLTDEDVASLCQREFAGMLLLPTCQNQYLLAQQTWPTVLLDTMPSISGLASVRSDHQAGARRVTEHLIQQGHRRIAYVFHPSECLVRAQHLLGYQEALANAKPCEGETLELADLDGPTLRRLFCGDERYTAVFCCNDTIAQQLLQRFKQGCFCIPRDVAMAGYDNAPIASRLCPPLTTVDPGYTRLASEATELLRQLMVEQGSPKQVVIPPQLVVRSSSPPPLCCPHFP